MLGQASVAMLENLRDSIVQGVHQNLSEYYLLTNEAASARLETGVESDEITTEAPHREADTSQ